MPLYLLQAAYSNEALKALVDKPVDRTDAVREGIERLGAKLIGFWYSFGEFDVVALVDAPDNTTVTAYGMATRSTGSVTKVLITPLMTAPGAGQAMRKAADAQFQPPG